LLEEEMLIMRTQTVDQGDKNSGDNSSYLYKVGVPFRSLRWRLTLSYTLVTISALLVVELILVVLLMTYFANSIDLSPENLVTNLRAEWTPKVQQFFSEEPPDVDGLRNYLKDVQGTVIGTRPLFILGNLQVEMKARDFLNFYYLLDDRTLVDVIPPGLVPDDKLGQVIPFDFLPGLERPLQAALDGIEDENLLYEKVASGNRITGAIPVFRFEPIETGHVDESEPDIILDVERKLVGVIVFTTKRFPWEFLPIDEVLVYIGRSLLIFTLFAGILGTFFGLLNANDLAKRLSKLSQAAHDWSSGDFSVKIHDKADDEVGKLAKDLNSMAEQLENLLDRRLEISVLEERNRLARDLHDSVKQQAFAASAQLGAAKARFSQDPQQSYGHLTEADLLLGKVRQELTDLIDELRPVEMKGKGLIAAVKDYAQDWSRRNAIEVVTHVRGDRGLPLDVEKCIFRVIQEALANVAWHSAADRVDLVFNFRSDFLLLTIRDNGQGFDVDQSRKRGMGLNSMCERVVIVGGEIDIDSHPDQGTKIILKIPYQEMEI
jgi:signal transduction histidine kinase